MVGRILLPRERPPNRARGQVESPPGQSMVIKTPITTRADKPTPMDLGPLIPGGKWIWAVSIKLMRWKFGTVKDLSHGSMGSPFNYWMPIVSRFTRAEKQKVPSVPSLP